jgi:hypothetical protein
MLTIWERVDGAPEDCISRFLYEHARAAGPNVKSTSTATGELGWIAKAATLAQKSTAARPVLHYPNDMTPGETLVAHCYPRAADVLLPLVYQELRRLAARKLARELPGNTLQPGAGSRAWLRLAAESNNNGTENPLSPWRKPCDGFSSIRPGGKSQHAMGQSAFLLDTMEIRAPDMEDRLLAVHEALDRFAKLDPSKAELVKLHYFAGLSLAETGEMLRMSLATVKRHWIYARAWLFREIKHG